MLTPDTIHMLLDLVLDCIADPGPATCREAAVKTVLKLVPATKGGLYIPGRTLALEKEKAMLMQHGLLVVLALFVIRSTAELGETKAAVERHLAESYTARELQWSFRSVMKLADQTKAPVQQKEAGRHLDLLQGKELRLSEYES